MNPLGFLDFYTRLSRIDKAGDPLIKLNETVDWEIFRSTLEQARKTSRSKTVTSRKDGAKTKNTRKIPMPAGPKRITKAFSDRRIIYLLMWPTSSSGSIR